MVVTMESLISSTLFVVDYGLGFVNLFIFSPKEFSSKNIGFSTIFIKDLYHPGVSPLLGVE
jgi:hypothetical protein